MKLEWLDHFESHDRGPVIAFCLIAVVICLVIISVTACEITKMVLRPDLIRAEKDR